MMRISSLRNTTRSADSTLSRSIPNSYAQAATRSFSDSLSCVCT